MSTKIVERIDIQDFFANAKEIWIAVALMQKDIAEQILRACKIPNKKLVHAIVGIDLPTDPDALELLHESGCDLSVYKHNKITYHPKVYVVKKRNGQYASLIGSANATRQGFDSNVELSVFNNNPDFCKSVQNWIERIDKKSLIQVNPAFLEKYKEVYKERQQDRVNLRQSEAKKRLLLLWDDVLEQSLIDFFQRKVAKYKEDEYFNHRGDVILKLRKAMDVAHNFQNFDCDAYVHIPELGSVRINRPFQQQETIDAMAALYIAPDVQIASAFDNLCSIKDVGIAYASKVLCARDPKKYMVINGPVKKVLRSCGMRGISGEISGAKYLEICKTLVRVLEKLPEVKDFAQLDLLMYDS